MYKQKREKKENKRREIPLFTALKNKIRFPIFNFQYTPAWCGVRGVKAIDKPKQRGEPPPPDLGAGIYFYYFSLAIFFSIMSHFCDTTIFHLSHFCDVCHIFVTLIFFSGENDVTFLGHFLLQSGRKGIK